MSSSAPFQLLASCSRGSNARVGQYLGKLQTPACLLYTRAGMPVHLTPDNLDLLPALQGFHVPLQDMFALEPTLLRTGQSLVEFLRLQNRGVIFATPRDSVEMAFEPNTKNSTAFWARNGRTVRSNKQYAEFMSRSGADAFEAMSEDLGVHSSEKMHRRSLDRSLQWLDETLLAVAPSTTDTDTPEEAKKESQQGASASSSSSPSKTRVGVWAAVQGGANLEYRAHCAKEMAARPGVEGFRIGGLYDGESPEVRASVSCA
jgi:queuine/archaeosine tRNA-ribosyltransferase